MKAPNHAPRLSDVAYERLLHALFNSEVPMGGRVSQGDLVKLTGMPVGAIREALKVLEADGLLVVHPRSGIELIQPSDDLVRSTMQFRMMIEKPAARRFALLAEQQQLDELIGLHESLEASLRDMNPATSTYDTLQQAEEAFHTTIVSCLNNELVNSAYRRLQFMARIVRGRATFFPPVVILSIREHLAVLNACVRRDPDAADAAMATHLTNAMNRNLGI